MCTSPLARLETDQEIIKKDGTLGHEAIIKPWYEIEKDLNKYKSIYRKVDQIPCGQCLECRMNYARQWANRIVLEKQDYKEDECWFLTLTYADEHLPFHRTVNVDTGETFVGTSLNKNDFTLFMKRLRYNANRDYHIDGIRFFMCGEYGSAEYTSRPHYHVIIFGLPLDPTKLKKVGQNEMGQPLFTHPFIEEAWTKTIREYDDEGNFIRQYKSVIGMHKLGRVTWESACYVARYTMKKIKGPDAKWIYGIQGKIPEYVNMSRKPGIGMKYFYQHKEDIYTTDMIPVANKKTAQLVRPPKAFDRIMEKLEPEFMEELKAERKKKAEELEELKFLHTDKSREEYRHDHEEVLASKIKLLPRKEL